MPQLSVILITKNASAHIVNCLQSVQFANEIIILDSGSQDDTLTLARPFTTNITTTPDWPGFGPQKNRALARAQGEWILSIDADEQISPTLQLEIQHAIQQTTYTAFQIPRLSSYCHRWIQHSGWQPDYVTRLFKRHCGQFTMDLVHEKVQITQGQVGRLNSPLLHHPFDSLEEVLDKLNHYSTAWANMRFQQGQRSNLAQAIGHGCWAFIRTYLLRRGFLDGREGFLLAISNAEGTYYRYLKLLYLQEHVKKQS